MAIETERGELPAILGGAKAVGEEDRAVLKWPLITEEDEAAVVEVMRRGVMSGNDVTRQFEREFAEFFGVQYALGACNCTSSLLGALWGCGVRSGDEVIAPSLTYWAAVMQVWSLRATIVFADVDADSLCIDPSDIEHRITDRTRAIIAVHQCGHPCDMDALTDIARRHNLKLIEDASHAHGGLYKGRLVGTIGDVGCMSMMTGKSLIAGEAGMLITNDRSIWERAISFGFYERTTRTRWTDGDNEITDPELTPYAGLPMGGVKHRMNQMSAALGRVQFRHYPARMAEIDRAMKYFWSQMEGVPGIRPLRVDESDGSTMGGWYYPHAHYRAEELDGLPLSKFVAAVAAEYIPIAGGIYPPLHLHPLFNEADVYGEGLPTAIAHCNRDVRCPAGSLPVSEAAPERLFMVPWFKKCDRKSIDAYVRGLRKVVNHAGLLKG